MYLPRYASIDVGSNTVRLLLAERRDGGNFRPLRVERRITRLGGNFSAENMLDEKAMLQTLSILQVFAQILREERVEAVFAVATGVVREAKNGIEFIEKVWKETGISLRLISGEEEARLMLRGVLWSLKDQTLSRIVADIGGWSTEILWVQGNKPEKTRSLGLGALILCEKFLKSDPPELPELESLEKYTQGILKETREWLARGGLEFSGLDPHLVGTAGTMTTLAAIDLKLPAYDPQKINGWQISRPALEKIYLQLRSLPMRDRRMVPGLETGREDLIVAGAVVVLSILKVFHLEDLLVIDSGLLEGVLLDGISGLS
jgi:exopolyphosphatase/guanosine-5'-triphosphate,3'-diphosphate pyrophosphatase